MKSLQDLTQTNDPAWPLVQEWLQTCPAVEILPADPAQADAALLQLQVTLRSPMGAVVHHTGGLLVKQGWLRILGSGCARMQRSLPSWTHGRAPVDPSGRPGMLLVADDVLGGWFAVNGGALGSNGLGHVFYFAPDSLQWEDLGRGYGDFLAWALSPNVEKFYDGLWWPGWEQEVGALSGDQCLSVYPFLWAEGPPVAERSRRAIPVDEMFGLSMDMAAQAAG